MQNDYYYFFGHHLVWNAGRVGGSQLHGNEKLVHSHSLPFCPAAAVKYVVTVDVTVDNFSTEFPVVCEKHTHTHTYKCIHISTAEMQTHS